MVNTPFVYTKSPPYNSPSPHGTHKSHVKNVKRIIVTRSSSQPVPTHKYFFGEFALRRLYST